MCLELALHRIRHPETFSLFMPRSSFVPSYIATHPLITSISLIGALLLLRWLSALLITAQKARSPQWRRSWLVLTRNGLLATFVVGLFIIWRGEIQTFALSIVGIAVAMVIATKELILCISGTLMIRLNGAFSVGDRIEVAGYRGDVIDINLLATTIIETGPGQLTQQYTGRKVVVPNSLFVGNGFINETFTNEYVLHVFSVPVSITADWRALEQCLLSAADESCAPYIEEARAHLDKLAHSEALNMPPVEVKVTLQIPSPEQINLIVRLPTPARTKGRIEQAILRKAMDCFPDWSPLNGTNV